MALKRVLHYFNIAVLVALIAVLIAAYWYAWRPMPKTSGTLGAPVSSDVTIARDALGVPHITAASVEDALFAQGFATAQDRLWQMDSLRRVANGTLSEVLGSQCLDMDRETRRLRTDRVAERAVTTLPEADRAALAAYARGVNHYIELHRGNFPIEFTLLGYEPRPWTVKDSMVIALHLYRELTSAWRDKLAKSALAAGGDAAKVAMLFPERAGGLIHPGSNAWVLAGKHTATGKPVLANDPHLEYSNPSIWHAVHLRAPGLDVTGVTLPGLPCVIIGHNDRIAWGVTNLGYDVHDLYIEKLDPRTGRYAFRGQPELARFERETIPVKDGRPVEFGQWVTRHGPVFSDQNRTLALRWAAADEAGLGYPMLDLNRARNWQEFTAALSRYPGPAQNFMYADSDGNIGYHAAGRLPIRKYDSSVPVDGSTGENEWEGYIPFEQLPQSYNPESGILITANDNPFPENYPYRVHGVFAAPYRAMRIRYLLASRGKWTAAEMARVQTDVYSPFERYLAREIVAAYDRRGVKSGDLADAIQALRTWDGQMKQGQAAPLIVALSYQHLRTALVERASPGNALAYQEGNGISAAYAIAPAVAEDLLRTRPKEWFADWDQLLLRSLIDAIAEGRRIQGRNVRKWDYGRAIEFLLPHPVMSQVQLVGRYFKVGPEPQSGSPLTVKQTTRRIGPSMRMAVDLADLDRSRLTLLTGESGHVLSSHYKDQWKSYYEGRPLPMPFRRIDVKDTLTLRRQ